MGFACMSAYLTLLGWVNLAALTYLYKAFNRCNALQSLLRSKIFNVCIQGFRGLVGGWPKDGTENRQPMAG